jgi:hypothetical protein
MHRTRQSAYNDDLLREQPSVWRRAIPRTLLPIQRSRRSYHPLSSGTFRAPAVGLDALSLHPLSEMASSGGLVRPPLVPSERGHPLAALLVPRAGGVLPGTSDDQSRELYGSAHVGSALTASATIVVGSGGASAFLRRLIAAPRPSGVGWGFYSPSSTRRYNHQRRVE